MSKEIGKAFLALLAVFGVGVSSLLKESVAYNYGPACQWIRLMGRVETPQGVDLKKPLLLTITYQLPEQKFPAILVSAFALEDRHFNFVLSGFPEEIEGVIFVPPLFDFAEGITFQVFATSSNGRWISEAKTVEYHPQPKKVGGGVRCQTKLTVEPLVLEKR